MNLSLLNSYIKVDRNRLERSVSDAMSKTMFGGVDEQILNDFTDELSKNSPVMNTEIVKKVIEEKFGKLSNSIDEIEKDIQAGVIPDSYKLNEVDKESKILQDVISRARGWVNSAMDSGIYMEKKHVDQLIAFLDRIDEKRSVIEDSYRSELGISANRIVNLELEIERHGEHERVLAASRRQANGLKKVIIDNNKKIASLEKQISGQSIGVSDSEKRLTAAKEDAERALVECQKSLRVQQSNPGNESDENLSTTLANFEDCKSTLETTSNELNSVREELSRMTEAKEALESSASGDSGLLQEKIDEIDALKQKNEDDLRNSRLALETREGELNRELESLRDTHASEKANLVSKEDAEDLQGQIDSLKSKLEEVTVAKNVLAGLADKAAVAEAAAAAEEERKENEEAAAAAEAREAEEASAQAAAEAAKLTKRDGFNISSIKVRETDRPASRKGYQDDKNNFVSNSDENWYYDDLVDVEGKPAKRTLDNYYDLEQLVPDRKTRIVKDKMGPGRGKYVIISYPLSEYKNAAAEAAAVKAAEAAAAAEADADDTGDETDDEDVRGSGSVPSTHSRNSSVGSVSDAGDGLVGSDDLDLGDGDGGEGDGGERLVIDTEDGADAPSPIASPLPSPVSPGDTKLPVSNFVAYEDDVNKIALYAMGSKKQTDPSRRQLTHTYGKYLLMGPGGNPIVNSDDPDKHGYNGNEIKKSTGPIGYALGRMVDGKDEDGKKVKILQYNDATGGKLYVKINDIEHKISLTQDHGDGEESKFVDTNDFNVIIEAVETKIKELDKKSESQNADADQLLIAILYSIYAFGLKNDKGVEILKPKLTTAGNPKAGYEQSPFSSMFMWM